MKKMRILATGKNGEIFCLPLEKVNQFSDIEKKTSEKQKEENTAKHSGKK